MLVKDAARRDAAELLREQGDLTLPVDPFAIARDLGFNVEVTALRPDLSGAIVSEGGRVTILIEESDPIARQVFTCAHEIGHYFERKRNGDLDFSFVEVRQPGNYDLHEYYADEFAGSLLMPEKEFKAAVKSYGSDYRVAADFGVSPAAVRMRRKRLNV